VFAGLWEGWKMGIICRFPLGKVCDFVAYEKIWHGFLRSLGVAVSLAVRKSG
jgi:hypothetical protein